MNKRRSVIVRAPNADTVKASVYHFNVGDETTSPRNTSGVPADLGRAVLMLLAPVSKSLPMQPIWGPN